MICRSPGTIVARDVPDDVVIEATKVKGKPMDKFKSRIQAIIQKLGADRTVHEASTKRVVDSARHEYFYHFSSGWRPFCFPLSSLPAYAHSPQPALSPQRNAVNCISSLAVDLPSALYLSLPHIARICQVVREILAGK